MKIFLLAPHEDWICDRFVQEWLEHNSDISVSDPAQADIVWLLADWAWNQVSYEILRTKRVVTSIHHIVPEKFGARERAEFIARDVITDQYHVPCVHTEKQVRVILDSIGSTTPIVTRPFWVNQNQWPTRSNANESTLRRQLMTRYGAGDPMTTFLVGSFQRDTEGHDLLSPKKEKGPDQLCDMIEILHAQDKTTRMMLAGWRRQYVMKRLDSANISYRYIERPSLSVVWDLYNIIDLYVVAARYEGGPQSIVECAAMGVPIVSTDVGLAPEILDPRSIFNANNPAQFLDAVKNAQTHEAIDFAYKQVSEHFLPKSFSWYIGLFGALMEEGIKVK